MNVDKFLDLLVLLDLFKVRSLDTIIIGIKPIKKPPVGPMNTPNPLWKELNTGIPIIPNRKYINSITTDFFRSSTCIKMNITSVWRVNGITKGIVNHELITSRVVKKAIKLML